jgi:hypothetical protein
MTDVSSKPLVRSVIDRLVYDGIQLGAQSTRVDPGRSPSRIG